jgi:hypothetical protein
MGVRGVGLDLQLPVIPAKAGIYGHGCAGEGTEEFMDSRLRGNDKNSPFGRNLDKPIRRLNAKHPKAWQAPVSQLAWA